MQTLLFLLLSGAASLAAALRPLGAGELKIFDASRRAWRSQGALVLYQADPEILQLHLPDFQPRGPLNARLDLEQLPHYRAWVERQRAEGGLPWKLLSTLLNEVQGRPIVFLTLGPLPAQGPAELRVGLLEGRHFKLYGRVQGNVASGQRGLVFEAQTLIPENPSARSAWSVLAPLVRAQAARIAGQR
jgi:hypothetical protein